MLLQTNIKLERLTNVDMVNMVGRMKRGGLCFVGSKRDVTANRTYMPFYERNKASNSIIYEGANNLFRCSMSEYSPYNKLRFNDYIEL